MRAFTRLRWARLHAILAWLVLSAVLLLADSPPQPAAAADPQPAVLLVHGWNGSCATFANLKPWLEAQLGIPGRVECFDPPDDGRDGYRFTEGTKNSAKMLKAYADDFASRMAPLSGNKIHIVAHSFGGIVSRWYIENPQLGGAAKVESLTMLGTPNRGTKMADIAFLSDLVDLEIEDIAAWDMRRASNKARGRLWYLNNTFVMPRVRYRAVAGNASAPAWRWLLGEANDCVVPVESVKGPFPASTTVRGNTHPGACILGAPALTNDPPPGGDCTIDPAHAFCDTLANIEGAGGLAPIAPFSLVTPAAASLGAFPGTLAYGEQTNVLVVDPSATAEAFSLQWLGESDDLRLRVQRPDSSYVEDADPGVTHWSPQEVVPGLWIETYEITGGWVGPAWTAHVEAVSPPPDGVDYVLSGAVDSPVLMAFEADPVSPLSEPSFLTVTLSESGAPITNATVYASVTQAGYVQQSVQLSHIGGGTYGGYFTPGYPWCGVFLLNAVAEGTSSFGYFRREEMTFVDPSTDLDCDGSPESEDNCELIANNQANADAAFSNGPDIAGDDVTVPNGDPLDWEGDACETDGDTDNDARSDADEMGGVGCFGAITDVGGDVAYSDGDPPSWDTDGDAIRDGAECSLGTNPTFAASKPSTIACGSSGDADGDGLRAAWETCKWGTSDTSTDSDGDGLGDCREVADVDGDTFLTFPGDVLGIAKIFFLSGVADNAATDIDGDSHITFPGDVLQLAGFFFGIPPCA
jgi:pimeloyl-ACP methyl ester carboxylesterase